MECLRCTVDIAIGSHCVICSRCSRPYHLLCWEDDRKCSCGSTRIKEQLMTSNLPALVGNRALMERDLDELIEISGDSQNVIESLYVSKLALEQNLLVQELTFWNDRGILFSTCIGNAFFMILAVELSWVFLIPVIFLFCRMTETIDQKKISLLKDFWRSPKKYLKKHPELYPLFERYIEKLKEFKEEDKDKVLRIEE